MKKLEIGIIALLMILGSTAWAQHSGKPVAPTQNQSSPVQNPSESKQNQPATPQSPPAPEAPVKTPEERATAHSKKLNQRLGLNPEQQKSVYDLCLKRAKQDDADNAKFKNDKEGMKNAHRLAGESFEKSIETVLTPDQKTK